MEHYLNCFNDWIRRTAGRAAVMGISALLIGCNPLEAFDPVTINDNQVFAIQAQDVNSTTTASTKYEWSNPHSQALVHHATTTRGAGSASIRITDAVGTLVYSSTLMPDRSQLTTKGVPGTWEITITMTGYTGTLSFQILAGAP